MSKVTDTLEAYEIAHKNLSALTHEEIFAEFKAAFEQAPRIKSFSWRQYTPSFNDGDLCTFRAYIDYEDGDGMSLVNPEDSEDDPEVIRQYEIVEAVYNMLPESFLEEKFGSYGARVTADRDADSLEVEEYDCGY